MMAHSNRQILKDKRVIITGGSGFFGSFVQDELKNRQPAEIIVPRSKRYDLRNLDAIHQLISDTFSEEKPVDLIIHIAGIVGGIGANQKSQAEFFYDNLMMGVQLQHEAYLAGIPKFVGVGTICSYPKMAPVPFREDDLWNGYPEETNAPYGLAKKMMLVQSQIYRKQYGYDAIHILPVNLYGPRDNFDLETSHVIPALIRKCIEAKESGKEYIDVWGDGSPTREFLYVEDAARGLVLAAENYSRPEPVNLGSGFEISIKDLAEKIAAATGFEGELRWQTDKPNGQPRRMLDVSRARKAFGFEATTDFDAGISATVNWFLENRHNIP